MASARAPLSATSCGLWQAVAHADRNPGPRGRRGGPGRLGIGARKPRPRVSRTRRRCAGSPRPMQRTKLSRAPTWATGQPRERPTWRRKTGSTPEWAAHQRGDAELAAHLATWTHDVRHSALSRSMHSSGAHHLGATTTVCRTPVCCRATQRRACTTNDACTRGDRWISQLR